MCLKDGETVTVCVTLGERETGGGDFPLWSAALETVDFGGIETFQKGAGIRGEKIPFHWQSWKTTAFYASPLCRRCTLDLHVR